MVTTTHYPRSLARLGKEMWNFQMITVENILLEKYKSLVDYIEKDVFLADGIADWEETNLRNKIKEIRKIENS